MSQPPVTPGQMLAGKYRIERVLGAGGMGVVVEAHDLSLERRVAIKFLLPDFTQHPEATQRFTREARAAVKIQSEHVARVIDVSTLENGAPYMVMEFLEGSDLARVIDTTGPLGVEDAAFYIIQACEALAEAHAHGIIHRDLKPANLFLAEQAGGSRKIKVLDFGISKVLSTTDPGIVGSLTRTSMMMGSPLYMSPEQMKSARDVDLRTDIWALGVILYEVLSGQLPFNGGSVPEISAKILLTEPKPLCEARADVPEGLSAAVTRALSKQPEQRYQHVGELALDLLPFAPQRARSNVERIIRVLNAAGIARAEFLASLLPEPGSDKAVAVLPNRDVVAERPSLAAGKRRGGTLASWGQTHGDGTLVIPKAKSRAPLALGALAVVALGAILAFTTRSPAPRAAQRPSPSASAGLAKAGATAPLAAAQPTTAAPLAVPADDAAASAGAATPSVRPLGEPEALPPSSAPPAPPADAESAAKAAPPSSISATARPAAPPTAGAARPDTASDGTTTKTARAPAPARKPSGATSAKAGEKPYPVDFKSRFGSRK